MTYIPGQNPDGTPAPMPQQTPRSKETRSGYLDAVAELGLKWLNSQPSRNVVTDAEFSKFLPLFSKQAIEKMSEETTRKLSLEYSQRFSPHHPIHVLDTQTPDPDGMVYPGREDDTKYKVIATIPARLNRLESVNVLGERVVEVAAECMANTRSTSNPFENKGEYYSQAMAHLVKLANQKGISQQSAEFKKYEAALLNKGEANPEGTSSESSEPSANPSGIDADWDE